MISAAKYRVIHFVPDPFLEGRIPIAVAVDQGDGATLVRVPHLPGERCLGGRGRGLVLLSILGDLEAMTDITRLPGGTGPQVVMGPMRQVPAGVEDAVSWVHRLVDPEHPAAVDSPEGLRERNRATAGLQFLATYKVDRYVKKRFDPAEMFKDSNALRPISQFVPGAKEILLMEPIVLTRPAWQDEIREVAERFAAYQHVAREQAPAKSGPVYLAYLLSGAKAARRDEARREIGRFATAVFDTEDPATCGHFIDRVRSVGRSAELPA